MRTITTETTLADLAITHSGASRVFHRHGLDFCCHGDASLKETCDRLGISFDRMVEEIRQQELNAEETFDRWDEKPLDDLIGHILEHFHAAHREELPRFVSMAKTVEASHATKGSCPRGLSDHLKQMSIELERHMQKEERILFPLIRDDRGGLAIMPIHVIEQEHEDIGESLARVRKLTRDFHVPDDACATWRALYIDLSEFEEELMQHIHLENNVLFPRALGRGASDGGAR